MFQERDWPPRKITHMIRGLELQPHPNHGGQEGEGLEIELSSGR